MPAFLCICRADGRVYRITKSTSASETVTGPVTLLSQWDGFIPTLYLPGSTLYI